jgi:hypothetical protein
VYFREPFVQASHTLHTRSGHENTKTHHRLIGQTQPEHQYKITEISHNNKRTQPAATLVNTTTNLTTRDTRDINNEKKNIYTFQYLSQLI